MRRYIWFIVIALAIVFLFARQLAWFYTEWLWFREVGYPQIFWARFWVKGVVGFLVGFLFAALIYVNLVLARRLITWRSFRYPGGWWGRILFWLETGFQWALVLVAVLFGAFAGVAAAKRWEIVLQFLFGVPMGATDPVFGKDISFYLFRLPFWLFIYDYTFGALALAFVLTLLFYAFHAFTDLATSGRYLPNVRAQLRALMGYATPLIRTHLFSLIALLLFWGALHFRLSMFELLYGKGNDEVVWGAGYTDLHVRLPVLWVLTIVFVLGGLLVLWNIHARTPVKAALGLVAVFAVTWLSGNFLPHLFQRYIVKPNELEKELLYLSHNIRMTRLAYGIHNIKTMPYPFREGVTEEALKRNSDLLASVRLWDYRPLQLTLKQIQSIRAYYEFADVDVDRYVIGGVYRQVMLAARELNVEQLRPSWFSRHFQWTHGYGAVVVPVNEVEQEGQPVLWVRDIPPKTDFPELRLRQPRIYFGEMTNDYVVVRTRGRQEFDYPISGSAALQPDSPKSQATMAKTTYEGKGGVPIGNYLQRLAFALRFGEPKLFLADVITKESRLLFRRNIHERLRAIAPFLLYDTDPYLVIADGKLFWICDAYTTSDRFPYSEPFTWEQEWGQEPPVGKGKVKEKITLNYIRNSVKVIIDAYDGTVGFYLVDETDPIAKTYRRIFPRLFLPLSAMPESLRRHLRYPVTYFRIQAEMLLLYHMTDPEQFYQREDLWTIAQEVYADRKQDVEPYYIMMRMPRTDGKAKTDTHLEFALILPFTPFNPKGGNLHTVPSPLPKENLIALLLARCDFPRLSELVVLVMPSGKTIFGTAQVEARIDNDPEISPQLTLWKQLGSDVLRGNLLVIPLDGSLLYVEPLFLVATQTQFPELKRVIVANQRRVVMDESLPKALARLIKAAPEEIATKSLPPPSGTALTTLNPELQTIAQKLEESFRQIEESARKGDWAKFGEGLKTHRSLLQQLRQQLSTPTPQPAPKQ